MSKKKEERLRGGLEALLGGAGRQGPKEAQPVEVPDREPSVREQLISTLEDEELKRALHNRRMNGRGRPKKSEEHKSQTLGYSRACIIVNDEKMNKLKEIAFRETVTLKELFESIMELAIERYEAKHGEIRLRGEENRDKDISSIFK